LLPYVGLDGVERCTRIRFGEGRSVTVVEPLDEVIDRLNRTTNFAGT